ncbi:hypothetical protein A3A84_04240 [Candidatus Collierbacteria bacterium RIFCSPLOWO2_01_FULL_50_23]|uniref:Uncharacterized protein n=2 Tax=Candidatus Collieribacteriota TaxID=1752725 RepID=A0A1F5EVF2_9BACT|nr:MAG: hypothetical protein A3D09_02025 [Candidatus Collierbacteria bacterium RIFCSPHIGHO2_02_FULL_49_10]OGD71676.1 MAG: hypothetical protein A2703_01745 [Candidatus Collierbacteria bacterium RIFCSPHIGHO2_01_FULL_50_25]OGD73988.1 MAG: hypothetical protein A3A84_04240 [Candidatus Collierbacteria bacterium RIFCSPLOWO2_01_FULL_50_23]
MSHEQFAQRVREKLGHEISPLYIENLLDTKSPAELILWIQTSIAEYESTFMETAAFAESDWQHGPDQKSIFDLGLRIIEGRMKLYAFILEELRARVNAVEEKPERRILGKRTRRLRK